MKLHRHVVAAGMLALPTLAFAALSDTLSAFDQQRSALTMNGQSSKFCFDATEYDSFNLLTARVETPEGMRAYDRHVNLRSMYLTDALDQFAKLNRLEVVRNEYAGDKRFAPTSLDHDLVLTDGSVCHVTGDVSVQTLYEPQKHAVGFPRVSGYCVSLSPTLKKWDLVPLSPKCL